jgi:hypothetical protein
MPSAAERTGTATSAAAVVDESGHRGAGSPTAAAFNRLIPDAVTPTLPDAKNDTPPATARRKTNPSRDCGSLWALSVDDFFASLPN